MPSSAVVLCWIFGTQICIFALFPGADLEPIFPVKDRQTCVDLCDYNPSCMGYQYVHGSDTLQAPEIIYSTGKVGHAHCKLKPYSRVFDTVFDDDTLCQPGRLSTGIDDEQDEKDTY